MPLDAAVTQSRTRLLPAPDTARARVLPGPETTRGLIPGPCMARRPCRTPRLPRAGVQGRGPLGRPGSGEPARSSSQPALRWRDKGWASVAGSRLPGGHWLAGSRLVALLSRCLAAAPLLRRLLAHAASPCSSALLSRKALPPRRQAPPVPRRLPAGEGCLLCWRGGGGRGAGQGARAGVLLQRADRLTGGCRASAWFSTWFSTWCSTCGFLLGEQKSSAAVKARAGDKEALVSRRAHPG